MILGWGTKPENPRHFSLFYMICLWKAGSPNIRKYQTVLNVGVFKSLQSEHGLYFLKWEQWETFKWMFPVSFYPSRLLASWYIVNWGEQAGGGREELITVVITFYYFWGKTGFWKVKVQLKIRIWWWGVVLPGGPVVKTALPMQGAWVWTVVRGLRFLMPCSMAKKIQNKKK